MTAPKTKTKIMTRRIATGLALVISLSLSGAGAEPPEDGDASLAAHVLNRITFGPRPGDIERVAEMGIAAFIEEQLQPAAIDDGALERQLSGFETLELDTADLIERYHLPAFMALRDRRRAAMADTPTDEPPRRPGQDLPPEVRQSRQPVIELTEQKLIRAVSSERQLQEVLVDFWFNHFNVSARKGLQIHPYLIEYERDVLRPHVLGNFRDLLGAVAESPAMLIYLDNWLSSDPDAEHPFTQEAIARRDDMTRGGGTPGNWRHLDRSQRRSWRQLADTVQGGPRNGLNENYARELLELHTLGVDGGYTQQDIVETARALTGWTLAPYRRGGGFSFSSLLHVDGDKQVLGATIDRGGKRDGEAVLDLLANHPSTARFIATKLATRFVADDPPASLVERTADRFLETGGDLREVVRAILTAPEFLAPDAHRGKIKTPLEFVVSSIRALDGTVTRGRSLALSLGELGMPPYRCAPPTGYSDRADAWVNTGSLLTRMNVALALVSNHMPGVEVGLPSLDSSASAAIDDLLDHLVRAHASDTTRGTLDDAVAPEQLAALALGSPEFQRQ